MHVITWVCCSCLYIQFGITPLDVARDSCRHDVVEYLEQILSKCSISTLYEFQHIYNSYHVECEVCNEHHILHVLHNTHVHVIINIQLLCMMLNYVHQMSILTNAFIEKQNCLFFYQYVYVHIMHEACEHCENHDIVAHVLYHLNSPCMVP